MATGTDGVTRKVVLGEYYYPKGWNSWIDRGSKTEFQTGDTIIVKDDRITVGRGTVPGPCPYQLDDLNAQIVKTSCRIQTPEQVAVLVFGAAAGRAMAINDSWAMHVLISTSSGTISATFTYYDPDSFESGAIARQIDRVEAFNLATIVSATSTTTSTSTTQTTSTTASTSSSATTVTTPSGSTTTTSTTLAPARPRRRP